jgi:hypothetical protein
MKKILIFVLGFIVIFPFAYCEESLVVVEKVAKDFQIPWWVPTLSNVVSAGFLALLGWFFNHIIGKHQDDTKYKEAIESLKAGIESSHNTMREAWNKAAADSILTKEEKSQLREAAWQTALNVAKGPVKDFILSNGKDWAFAKIRDIIEARKAKK